MFNKMLLATAAVIVTVAGAQAADLPSKKAAPVNYVKICDTYGAGYFFIPGSDTCLKIGGRVRYDIGFSPKGNYFNATTGAKDTSAQDTYGQHVRGRMSLDARTPSDYGTIRTYFAMRVDYSTGMLTGVQAPYATSSVADYNSKKTTAPVMEAAYIQFAGFTAGKMPEIVAGDWFGNMMNYGRFASFSTGVFGVSYTAVLGGGVSATVGFEDNDAFDGNNTTTGTFAAPFQTPYDSLPVLAGKLAWDQSWGQIQVSGGVSQNRSVNQTNATTNVYNITRSGYAFAGQLTLNADMIAKGDKFYLLGGYSSGLNKLGFRNGHKDGLSRDVDGVSQSWANFYCNATATVCDDTKSTWGTVAFLHYWTPTIRQNIVASVASVDPGAYTRSQLASTQKTTYTQFATNVFWTPVKGLDLGVEAMYNRASVGNLTALGCNAVATRTAGCSQSGDNFQYRLRVQRDF